MRIILQRLSDISAYVSNLRNDVLNTRKKIDAVSKRCDCLEFDLANMRATVNAFENAQVDSDPKFVYFI